MVHVRLPLAPRHPRPDRRARVGAARATGALLSGRAPAARMGCAFPPSDRRGVDREASRCRGTPVVLCKLPDRVSVANVLTGDSGIFRPCFCGGGGLWVSVGGVGIRRTARSRPGQRSEDQLTHCVSRSGGRPGSCLGRAGPGRAVPGCGFAPFPGSGRARSSCGHPVLLDCSCRVSRPAPRGPGRRRPGPPGGRRGADRRRLGLPGEGGRTLPFAGGSGGQCSPKAGDHPRPERGGQGRG